MLPAYVTAKSKHSHNDKRGDIWAISSFSKVSMFFSILSFLEPWADFIQVQYSKTYSDCFFQTAEIVSAVDLALVQYIHVMTAVQNVRDSPTACNSSSVRTRVPVLGCQRWQWQTSWPSQLTQATGEGHISASDKALAWMKYGPTPGLWTEHIHNETVLSHIQHCSWWEMYTCRELFEADSKPLLIRGVLSDSWRALSWN